MIEVKSVQEFLVRIPYHMSVAELAIDPAAVGSTMDHEMDDLNDHYCWADEEEMYHVFLGMVLLHEKTGAPLADCLHTAKIWWRG